MSTKEQAIAKIAERIALSLGTDASQYGAGTKFEELALKSANYSQLTTYLEDAFDVEVPYMDFRRKKTIGEAAEYIEELVGE
jgi:acyl carrier protein